MDKRTIEMALKIEKVAEDIDAAIVVQAMCWVLADLILQVEKVKGRPAHESMVALMNQLISDVERLRDVADTEAVH
jgi:hypothetical protein